ncbi:MAG: hypothetical protein Q4B69_02140 [Slackia sp.]|nr:hypothetical protein [Slackia sp.]
MLLHESLSLKTENSPAIRPINLFSGKCAAVIVENVEKYFSFFNRVLKVSHSFRKKRENIVVEIVETVGIMTLFSIFELD